MYSKSAEHKPRSAPVSMEGVEVQHSSSSSSIALAYLAYSRHACWSLFRDGYHLLPVVDCGVIHIFALGFLSFTIAATYLTPSHLLLLSLASQTSLIPRPSESYRTQRTRAQSGCPTQQPATAPTQPNPTPFALASWLALVLNHPPLHLRSPPPPPHSLVRGPLQQPQSPFEIF